MRATARRLLPWAILLAIFGAVAAYYGARGEGVPKVGYVLAALLGIKMLLSLRAKPVWSEGEPPRARIVAVLPFYNEDVATLEASLRSFLAQTRRPDLLFVVDDGSSSTEALERASAMAAAFASVGIEYRVSRQESNWGKREAMAVAFRAAEDTDLLVCVDSDSVLMPNAIEEALKPFSDPRVTAVAGLVVAKNHRRNLLTRLIDLRYANAFLYERGAYSSLGSVLCCCGSLAVYKAAIVRKHLPAFLSQRFLGRPVQGGDDRRLTNYCLLEGRVVLQESSVASTVVPERIGHYVRQQNRWNKSFFRESIWAVQHMPWKKPALALSVLELTSWLTFTTLMLLAVLIKPIQTGHLLLGAYCFFIVASSYARSVRYLDLDAQQLGRAERLGVYLIAPVYGLLHIVLLLPLRMYSLVTLARGGWGTRHEVEVSASERRPLLVYAALGSLTFAALAYATFLTATGIGERELPLFASAGVFAVVAMFLIWVRRWGSRTSKRPTTSARPEPAWSQSLKNA